ncbi:MAG: VWA domain-containing protein, partial [Oscillospiraceae bacterium]|nr:VWA domain-containing protein [Oscillospiraceae bacterium]
MKSRWKRLLASVLAASMLLSMVQIATFAATDDDLKSGTVADGAFVADQEKGTLPSEFTGGASNTVATPGGKVTVTKSATPVACPDGNQFEVTLQVVTKGEEIKTVTSPDAAVTLVIDLSSSMRDPDVNDKTKTRLEVAKAAAIDFVNSFVSGANGARRMVSLVGFWGGGEIVPLGEDGAYWINAADPANDNENLKLVAKAINDLPTDKKGTNIQAGLQLAANLYDCDKKGNTWAQPVAGIENRFSVLLTDGEPYDRIVQSINGTETSYYSDGENTKDDGRNTKYPTEAAQKLINAGIQSYAICFASGVQSWMKTADETVAVYKKREGSKWADSSESKWNEKKKDSDYKYASNITVEIDGKMRVCETLSKGNKTYYRYTDERPKTFDMAVKADGADALKLQFQTITDLIKLSVDAWTVTDPMGENVKFEEFVGNQGSATREKNLITWDLKAEKTNVETKTDGDKKTVTYTLKYLVSVNATGEHYDEDAVHPLNQYTELKYMFLKNDQRVDEDGDPYEGDPTKLDSIGFNVPGVIVERPIAKYTVNYWYKDRTTGNYELGETRSETAKLWSKTYDIQSTDYSKENYEFAKGPVGKQTLTEDNMVFDLYYDPIMTTATVNYHYKLTTINAQGNENTQEHNPAGIPVQGLYVGDRYELSPAEKSTFGGNTYSFVKAEPSAAIASLQADAKQNVIDLFYELTIDERADASVVVDHVYTLHTYELQNGKYVAKDVVKKVPYVVRETGLKAGMTYTASVNPQIEYSDYTYMNTESNVKVLVEGENKITLNFENREDPRGEELSLTVNHHYTKSVTTIDADGNVVTTVAPDNVVGRTDTIKFYAGETVTVDKQRVYNGDTYEIGGTSDTVTLPNPMNGAVYSLYYTLTEVPEKTTVTVNHIYQTVTHETVYTIAPDTKVITGTEVKDVVVTDDTETVTDRNVYKNQSYTAPVVGRDGYTCKTDENGRTAIVDADGTTVINVYYLKDGGDADNRDAASIDVLHRYTTHVTAIIGGEVREYDTFFTVPGEKYEGKVGDTYRATPVETYDGVKYDLVSVRPDAEVVLHAGTNSTIIINYERSDNQLVNTSYKVN